MLFSVEQAFVGREEIRAPLKMPAWEAMSTAFNSLVRAVKLTETKFLFFKNVLGYTEK